MDIANLEKKKILLSNNLRFETDKAIKNKENSIIKDLIKHKSLVFMALPAMIFFLIFSYIPMVGVYIAFVKFDSLKGIFGSPFVGLENFRFFFESTEWIKVTRNTIGLNLLFLVTGLIASVSIAIMLSEINNMYFKKITQSIVILPNFISWTVISLFSVALISQNGYFNQILSIFGNNKIEFYNNYSVWPVFLALIRIWHGAGFGSIVYLATITGINSEIYEAARIDGAKRWQLISYITIPLLKNTMIMLTILSVGKIFNGDFGMIYALVGNNPILYPSTDVIDTYVYRSLMQLGDMGMSSAVGLCQSVLGFIFVVASNYLAKKVSPESAIF